MKILEFIKNYWVQISFLIGIVATLITQILTQKKATLCSLKNDILSIWDKCKENQTITEYQLSCLIDSSKLYFKLGGDGFIHELVERIKQFTVLD